MVISSMKLLAWILWCVRSVLLVCLKSQAINELPQATVLKQAQQAFGEGDFPRVLELVESLGEKSELTRKIARLKILSLVRLGKTKEGVEVFDRYVGSVGHNEEVLLRELAIYAILPFRSDMREQVRGAAYSALKEIQSPEVLPYFQDGLSDGSGMIRVCLLYTSPSPRD